LHFKNVTCHARAAGALGFYAVIFLTGHYGPNWRERAARWRADVTGTSGSTIA
jgi:hypothetical protein